MMWINDIQGRGTGALGISWTDLRSRVIPVGHLRVIIVVLHPLVELAPPKALTHQRGSTRSNPACVAMDIATLEACKRPKGTDIPRPRLQRQKPRGVDPSASCASTHA